MIGLANAVIGFFWRSLVSYVTRRCTGEFMDSLFDEAIDAFCRATPSKVDDNLRDKWKENRK